MSAEPFLIFYTEFVIVRELSIICRFSYLYGRPYPYSRVVALLKRLGKDETVFLALDGSLGKIYS